MALLVGGVAHDPEGGEACRHARDHPVPRTNINCAPMMRMIDDPALLERRLAADRVWEIDTGHDLMITEPRVVAEMLLRLASV